MSEDLDLKYKKFIDALKCFFENDDNEYVSPYRTPSDRIDLTIVSDRFCRRSEATEFIEEEFHKLSSHFRFGFTSYYTIEEAEMLGIQPPISTVDKGTSWESVVRNHLNLVSAPKVCEGKKHKSKIVTFYSYKGGVGRTIALIQTAYLLAKKGKNVLLVDLDIEAPSLYDIFKDRLDIQCGLVDYLYEQVTSSDHTEKQIKLTDIFSQIKFDETLEGNVFVVPAGQLSSEYVFKLKQLQPQMISRKDYMNKLFLEFEDMLNVDIILVDSRTGLNEWGAFSLFDIADEMVFFAYPNQENVRGLGLIMDLVETSGCKNITMVFSRVDPDGEKYARDLFSILNLKQEFLSILYNPRIAVAKNYPIIDALGEYQELADFLNEDELVKINSRYLEEEAGNKKLFILEKLLENIKIGNIFTETEAKFRDGAISFIVGEKDILNERVKKFMEIPWHSIAKKDESFNLILSATIFDTNIQSELKSFFTDDNAFIETDVWFSYFLYMINRNSEQIIGISMLRGKKLIDYVNFILKAGRENVIEIFQDALQQSKNDKDRSKKVEYIAVLVINDISWMKEHQDHDMWLDGLTNAISFLRKSKVSKLNVKVLVTQQHYQERRAQFSSFKGSTYVLEWRKDDIVDLVEEIIRTTIIDTENLSDYIFAFGGGEKYTSFLKLLDEYKTKKIDDSQPKIERIFRYKSFSGEVLLKLLWGTRVEPGTYSKKVDDWFYENLHKTSSVNPIRVLKIMEDAVTYEIEDMKFRVNQPTCLLTIESLEKAFKLVSQ